MFFSAPNSSKTSVSIESFAFSEEFGMTFLRPDLFSLSLKALDLRQDPLLLQQPGAVGHRAESRVKRKDDGKSE